MAVLDMVRDGIRRFAGAKPPVDSPAPAAEVDASNIEFQRRARMSGFGQPQYIANTLDVQRIQNALRAAERGDTWLLFTIYRDMIVGYTHLQAEWNKRKMVITGQPETLIPHDPNDADDVIACEVIREMISNCNNWFDGLNHLLDATLYPMSVVEKIYEPVGLADRSKFKHPVRFKLKELAPVDYTLLCFKIPYIPAMGGKNSNPAMTYNPDDWEAWLRFYKTFPNGAVNWGSQDVYAPDREVHIVHRGNMMSPTIPPNFGGLLRAILFCWLLATKDRDWWGLFMQKYGMPLIVGKVDVQQKDTVQLLQQAIDLATQLGGIVIDKKAAVELQTVNSTDGSNAHKMFSDFWNMEVSKIVVGQSLSAKPEKTGMGSGAANQAEEVREDIRQYDTMKLGSDTLPKQLFADYLRVNGYKGRPPCAYWGGMRPNAANAFADTLNKLGAGGYELDDEGLHTASHKLGFSLQRREPTPNEVANPGGEKVTGKAVKY